MDVGEEVNVGVANEEGGSNNSTNKVILSSETECLDGVVITLLPIFATRYVHIRHGNSTYIGLVFKVRKNMYLELLKATPGQASHPGTCIYTFGIKKGSAEKRKRNSSRNLKSRDSRS